MIYFRKSATPKKLVKYKKQVGACYADMDKEVRENVLDTLLRDQHYLCAYCMGRIRKESMQIEHWLSQSDHSREQLVFKNMLGVCSGELYECNKVKEHCDRSKKDEQIKYHPSRDVRIENTLKYKGGELCSEDHDWNQQIEEVLRLNCGRLPGARLRALNAFIQALKRKRPKSNWDADFLRKQAEIFLELNEEKLPEFIGIVRYYCRKHLPKA